MAAPKQCPYHFRKQTYQSTGQKHFRCKTAVTNGFSNVGRKLVDLKRQSLNSLFDELAEWSVALRGSGDETTLSDNIEDSLRAELGVRLSPESGR